MVGKSTTAEAQTKFNDIAGHWAQPCIEKLAQQEIISGYADGSFKPNAPVNRAEFAAILNQAFPEAPEVRSEEKFSDVPTSYWASNAIRKAYQTTFLSGYPGGVFRSTEPITRVQALVSLANGLKMQPLEPPTKILKVAFTDAREIPEYAQKAIAAATENQLVVNYPEIQRFNPNQPASRADVAAFVCQATQTTGLVSSQYIPQVGIPTANLTTELRGVWLTNIDSDVLFSANKTTKALQSLNELNFNTVYPTVWNWGYTLYPSQVAQTVIGRSLDPEPGLQERDVLKEIVEQGHQQGMRVIPWWEFGFMAPAGSELAQRHPDWLTLNQQGKKIWLEGIHKRVWLNPFRPEVQQFIQDLILEVVSNYDIDGIQLDDHFGLPSEFGYDPFTVQLYQQEHQGKSPPADSQDAEWLRWRADKITDFLNQVFQEVKNRKPDVILSVSPNPQRFSYSFFLADWQKWERLGLVEELVVQIYRDSFSTFISELEQPELKAARSHIPVGIGILTGLKNRSVPFSQIQRQIEAVRRRGFSGVSFFFYETLWNISSEPLQQRQNALGAIFPIPAEPPELLANEKPSS
ncbi:family 10 glycosylhydrolase [Lyngbya aestuarii]|uniref:family 10 glycosylhydrolase n=1 Tax=Lyngbya aestuarii TaxID=118322 RepID=UPI00403DC21B